MTTDVPMVDIDNSGRDGGGRTGVDGSAKAQVSAET
jgi:hypothetical protein